MRRRELQIQNRNIRFIYTTILSTKKITSTLLQFEKIAAAKVESHPYTYMVAQNILPTEFMEGIARDFPQIKNSGFLPISQVKREDLFDRLIKELESQELSQMLSYKLGVNLVGKPCLISVRKWSAKKDGAIHNDSKSKIATMLIYLNSGWSSDIDGGRFRILHNNKNFEDYACVVPPTYGNMIAFVRSDNSWHGHKPFKGERRVIQITWLNSEEDLERKEKRGITSLMLKKIRSFFLGDY